MTSEIQTEDSWRDKQKYAPTSTPEQLFGGDKEFDRNIIDVSDPGDAVTTDVMPKNKRVTFWEPAAVNPKDMRIGIPTEQPNDQVELLYSEYGQKLVRDKAAEEQAALQKQSWWNYLNFQWFLDDFFPLALQGMMMGFTLGTLVFIYKNMK